MISLPVLGNQTSDDQYQVLWSSVLPDACRLLNLSRLRWRFSSFTPRRSLKIPDCLISPFIHFSSTSPSMYSCYRFAVKDLSFH